MGSHTQSHEEMTEESTFFSITTSRRIGMRSTFCQITQMRSQRQMFLIRVVIVPPKETFLVPLSRLCWRRRRRLTYSQRLKKYLGFTQPHAVLGRRLLCIHTLHISAARTINIIFPPSDTPISFAAFSGARTRPYRHRESGCIGGFVKTSCRERLSTGKNEGSR